MTQDKAWVRKIAIYCRISVEDKSGGEDGSIRNQACGGSRYVEGENHKSDGSWGKIVDTYIDDGYSGKNLQRPSLKRLLIDIRSGKIDTVLISEISRLSRSVKDWIDLRNFFDQHNASFITIRQHFDTSSAMGRAMLGFAIEFSQLEREQTAERVTSSCRERKYRGLWTGGPIPFGLERTERKGHLRVDLANKLVAEEIFDIFLRQGGALRNTVRLLNEKGIYRNG